MQDFRYDTNFQEDWKHPGPKPEWRAWKTDDEAREYDRLVRIWEARMVRFALIDGRVAAAYRDEAERDAMVRSRGLDPLACNRAMSRKK